MLRTLKSTDKFFLGERGFSLLGNCYLVKSNPYSWNDNTLTLKINAILHQPQPH